MQPASGLPGRGTDALIASVAEHVDVQPARRAPTPSSARLAIGIAFQSISGMLIAVITGLALKAMNRDSVPATPGRALRRPPGALARGTPSAVGAGARAQAP